LPRVITGFLSSALHPMIHIGFGIEFQQADVAAQGLAYAYTAYLDTSSLVEGEGIAEEETPLSLIEEIHAGDKIDIDRGESQGFQNRVKQVAAQLGDKLKEYALRYLPNPNKLSESFDDKWLKLYGDIVTVFGSQYVTAVGATRFINGNSGPEMAVDEFGSGGGFSTADAQPSYQSAAVAQYFKVQKDLPESRFYDKSGRGTPDVAALGWGFQVVVSGAVKSIGGTSASSPTFSAIISMLNDKRLNAGKSQLGFLNPWLYQTQASRPDAFFDVTQGDNQHGCCGLTGFRCAPGWDPVTGLGTPNFAVLSQLV